MTAILDRTNRVSVWLSGDSRAGLFSLGWSGLAQLIGLSIRLVSNVLLARILMPQAYGLLSSAMAVLTTLEWLSDLGIQPALVRHPRGSEANYLLTGWWLTVIRGTCVGACAMLIAGPLSVFWGQPELVGVLMGLALRPILFAFRSPGMPILRRELNYRALCIDEIIQTATGTAVSLALAMATHSVWSIVGGTICGTIAAVAISYILCPMRPRWHWDRIAAHDIGHLGRQVLLNTLVMALWMNMDRLLGLRFISVTEMGCYAVAWNLATVAEVLMARGCDVYFSVLARRGDPTAQAEWHRVTCRRITLFLMPCGAVAIIVAPLVIRTLYDSRYADARPIFAVLIARLLIRGLGQVQFQYLLARAEVNLATKAYLVALVVQAALFTRLVPAYGILGLALAVLGSTTVLTGVQTWLLHRKIGYGFTELGITLLWMTTGLGAVWLLA